MTLPKWVRDDLALAPGDRVEFRGMPDGTIRLGRPARDGLALGGVLHRPGRKRLSVAEMDAAIARRLASER
ncbi:MAG: AbrB/MazE/SpoVT family DNA-binding domain-containing protein [Thermoanaerobaculia bacterium]|nr:AbrB/MazE/SpoVT family DNA-binding domain-containing protein [Thermoanaerobaculia bacterium]